MLAQFCAPWTLWEQTRSSWPAAAPAARQAPDKPRYLPQFAAKVEDLRKRQQKEDGVLAGKANGLGDMTVELKYAFAELAGVNLAIKPAVMIPTGKSNLTENHWQD